MSKLLDKSLKFFAWYAFVLLIASIPAYYFIINAIWNEELDEHNYIIYKQVVEGFKKQSFSEEEFLKSIALWNKVQPITTILPALENGKDSIYNVVRPLDHDGVHENDRFRGLLTHVELYGKRYQIRIETNMEETDETVVAISVVTFIFIALLIIGFVILNKNLSRKIWSPFSDTLEKLKRFDLDGSASLSFKSTDIKEFQELNEVLSALIENNLTVYRQQKEFTQNASHELQTPLAVLKSKIDILIQDISLTEQQRKIIESLDGSVSRMRRINKNLLFLARIENKKYEAGKVNLSDSLTTLLGTFKEYLNNPVNVMENIQSNVIIDANESLVEILISNLLSNAFRHSEEGSEIIIFLDRSSLTVKNPGTEPLKKDFLFKRFLSASSQNPGTGLGLAIVKEICDKCGWKISYQFSGQEHIFWVTF